jgi:hypothetical protein
MFSFTTGIEVKVGLIAGGTGSLHRIFLSILSQLLETLVHLLADQISLFDPPLGSIRRPHSYEAAFAIQDLDLVPVLYRACLVENSGHAVPQDGLRRGNVIRLQNSAPAPVAAKKQPHQACRQR